jgi:hypothetical protein
MNKIEAKLLKIHESTNLIGGSMKSEFEEQKLAMEYIEPTFKVLELGSNIGINSIVISKILENDENLVTLECDLSHIETLTQNRDTNKLHFKIEPSALSSIPLAKRGWHTFPFISTDIKNDTIIVNTITYKELLSKYNINFDTIVADCEGALYFILKDMPSILTDIKLLIVENDYILLEHKLFVDQILLEYGFKCIKSLPGGFKNSPCHDCFYEVYKK